MTYKAQRGEREFPFHLDHDHGSSGYFRFRPPVQSPQLLWLHGFNDALEISVPQLQLLQLVRLIVRASAKVSGMVEKQAGCAASTAVREMLVVQSGEDRGQGFVLSRGPLPLPVTSLAQVLFGE